MRWSSDSFLSSSSSIIPRTTPGTSPSNSFNEDSSSHDSGIDDLYPDLSNLVKQRGASEVWESPWKKQPQQYAGSFSTEIDEEVYFTGSDDFDSPEIDVEDGGVPMQYSCELDALIMPTNLQESSRLTAVPTANDSQYVHTDFDEDEDEDEDAYEDPDFDHLVQYSCEVEASIMQTSLQESSRLPAVSTANNNQYLHAILDADADTYEDSDFDDLLQGPDFEQMMKKMDKLSIYRFNQELPFWAQYEATRVALHCKISLSNQEISGAFEEYMDELLMAYKATDHRSWYRTLAEFCCRHSCSLPRLRMSSAMWTTLQRGNWPQDKGISVSLTGIVKFNSSHDAKSSLFTILLNPLDTMRGNRFWRKFGSDRFLTLKLPTVPREESLPTKTPFRYKRLCTPDKFNEAIIDFLMQEPGIELLGRVWKCFFIRDPRERKQKSNSGLGPFQAILFAVSGEGIQENFGVEDLLHWHIPFVPQNLETRVPKLWSRISLGLTRTIEAIHFTEDQICPDPDNPRKHGQSYIPDLEWRNIDGVTKGGPMNDGCCIASPAVFKMIQRSQGQEEASSAVQGRLGPSKGLWIVDPLALKEIEQGLRDPDEMWIRVNDTQRKYTQHQTSEPDPAWTTLELVSWSRPPKSAEVNFQLMVILDHHGVPFKPLQDIVGLHLDTVFQELSDAIEDPVLLRHWVSRSSRTGENVEYQGGFPANPADRVVQFLDSGFRPESQGRLLKDLKLVMQWFWERLKTKLRVCIPLSVCVFCVADPTNTLREGEVSLHFSQGIVDENTGIRRRLLEGEILVGRNPALLPSDIQKVRAVDNIYLRDIKDVIVFSVQGMRSLASMLSGGDYDGDKCWVCWDQRIVQPFRGVVPGSLEFKEKDEWLTTVTTKVNELPGSSRRAIVREFLRTGAKHTLSSDPHVMGRYYKLHERYARTFGLNDEVSILLANICAELVDAPKQGTSLVPNHMAKLKEKFRQKGYSDDREAPCGRPDDIINRLEEFAITKIQEKEAEFNVRQVKALYVDEDLTRMAKLEDERARSDRVVKECLRNLRYDLDKVREKASDWGRYLGQSKPCAPGSLGQFTKEYLQPEEEQKSLFTSQVESCYAEYLAIIPSVAKFINHPTILRWASDANEPYSDWQLLKASCAYYKWGGTGALVWHMAGLQLCALKAKATGTRYVIEEIHRSLTTDKAYVKRRMKNIRLASCYDDDDDDDNDSDDDGGDDDDDSDPRKHTFHN